MQRLFKFQFLPVLFLLVVFHSCKENSKNNKNVSLIANDAKMSNTATIKNQLSEEFKSYWYAGKAEITSYKLEQARYGELRDGNAVLIYVTEPFLASKQVKADNSNPDNVSVLKLNSTKKFLTGIYPYSIMNSSFYPVADNQHAIKLTSSVQEWCGQVFTQLNNREKFEVNSFSYFESDGDQTLTLDKTDLENEIWNKIRINPNNLPQGNISIIPSLEYLRLAHKELKSYTANAELSTEGNLQTYKITYPELDRTLAITFEKSFPYGIEYWSETYKSGFGPDSQTLTTKATKIKTLNRAYWQENRNSDVFLRDSLGL
ncbi:septum formation inhibitor Maf [Arenibacter sp. F26102]|uniref:septum formation inhibitor Maf n=1 Tax=Arenibacter sp. F26102 TaxID=2926416 RepID=UPI001FF38586|nr:septum formation inhibitor Maf [Arenibacter sp. F26102]MCK0145509.1 septum formation inhibitor Maf [Arenibacter sp. F26102]